MNDDWVRVQFRREWIEMLDSWLEERDDNVGLCLLCGSSIRSEADFIPDTNTHGCAEGLRESSVNSQAILKLSSR
jgi:hypothetical protein